jgi:hypothetical protein
MALPASFPISASQINVELGRSAGAPFDIQGAEERDLAGVPSGAISMSDFLGKALFSVTNMGGDTSASAGTDQTFAGQSFGTAHADREMWYVVTWKNNLASARTLNAATIGGIAAIIVAQDNQNDGFGRDIGAAVFYAAVPSGTSGSVVMTMNNSVSEATIQGYRVIHRTSIVDFGTYTQGSDTTQTPFTNLNITGPQGVVFAAAAFGDNGSDTSWVGATEVQDADYSGFGRYSTAFISGLATESNRLVQATNVGSGLNGSAFAAVSIA